MNNPVLNAIAGRRSIRSYKSEKVPRELIYVLLKAAAESPSAKNLQPWHFSIVTNRALLDEIHVEVKKVLKEELDNIFHGAGTAIFLSCDPASRWGRLDCGIAVQNIALAAHSIGLGTVILGRPEPAFSGPRKDYFRKKLQFPDGYDFAVAIAVGIPAGTKDAHPVEPGRITFVE
jgi:nitroreductase